MSAASVALRRPRDPLLEALPLPMTPLVQSLSALRLLPAPQLPVGLSMEVLSMLPPLAQSLPALRQLPSSSAGPAAEGAPIAAQAGAGGGGWGADEAAERV